MSLTAVIITALVMLVPGGLGFWLGYGAGYRKASRPVANPFAMGSYNPSGSPEDLARRGQQ